MRKEEQAAIVMCVFLDKPCFLWGPPGQGKSSFIRGGFTQLNYMVHVLRINTILPHQIYGNQAPDFDNNTTKFLPPNWAIELNKAKKSVLFLDDVGCATRASQTATLGLMDEREVSGVKLKAVPIAASNPGSLATARFEIDAATANRCIHIPITSHAEAFSEQARAGFPAPQVPRIRNNWQESIDRKRELVTDFLVSVEGSALINSMPEMMNLQTVAWPSERSWETFWEILAVCDAIVPESIEGMNLNVIRGLLLRGCVGGGAFDAFNNYFLSTLSVTVSDILNNAKTFDFPENGDEISAILLALSNHLSAQSKLSKNKWGKSWGVVENLWETQFRDKVVPFVLDLVSIGSTNDGLQLPRFYNQTVRPALDNTI